MMEEEKEELGKRGDAEEEGKCGGGGREGRRRERGAVKKGMDGEAEGCRGGGEGE